MILITDIKYLNLDRDVAELWKYDPRTTLGAVDQAGDIKSITQEAAIEFVRGRHFVRCTDNKREDFYIGMDLDTQNLLGLQFEVWDNMVDQIEKAERECGEYMAEKSELARKISVYNTASRWQKIKFAFKGVEI